MKRFALYFLLVCAGLPVGNNITARALTEPSIVASMQDVKSAVRQAQARYDSGNVTGAADLARKILAKYPGNADAKAILEQCIATEHEDYEKAVGSMSEAELTNFQKKYPNSEYGRDVSKRIADLPFWLDAKEKNTLDSYRQYLTESIHQMYKRDADEAINELTIKQAYDTAVAVNTIKAFEQFRSKHPDSVYDKQASNKIARLMADKFNSKSTYADKNNALAYAKNEMTRDYVNNKYNKATEKKYSSSPSSTASSYGSSSRTTSSYSSSLNTSANNSYSYNSTIKRESIVNWGIQGFFELGNAVSPSYSGGLGVEMRIGAISKPFNLLIGARIGWASYRYSYYEKQYYGDRSWEYNSNYINASEKTTNVFIPAILNWNFVNSDWVCWYLGAGYQFGIPISGNTYIGQLSHAFLLQSGFGFRHFDIRMYYINYFKSMFSVPEAKKPVIGFSMTYYF